MRRLPVFFVLDCSESMAGDNLIKMERGLHSIVKTLRTNPTALETVHISIIAFAGVAKTIAPLIDLVSFYPPKLPLGGGTSLGKGLDTLMSEIDKSVMKTTADNKGDWKPIIYLFTDGRPTDAPGSAINKWVSEYSKKATLIAVGIGKSADFSALRRLTENVLVFENSSDGDFQKFVNWITASIVAQSQSVGEGGETQPISPLDESVMRIIKEPASVLMDEKCATFVGRCNKTRKPYIIRYEKLVHDANTQELGDTSSYFKFTGCYSLEEDYFAWSDPRQADIQISTSKLLGAPGCPHCGNEFAFAVCGCGRLTCCRGPESIKCPWCEQAISFSPPPSDKGFDVNRGRG